MVDFYCHFPLCSVTAMSIVQHSPASRYTPLCMTNSPVKIYHTHSASTEWKYYGHRGVLVFGKESFATKDDEFSFKLFLCDEEGTWRTLWVFKLDGKGFDYRVDHLPSFHWFHGLTRKFGILFEDDDDAGVFARVICERNTRTSASPVSFESDSGRRLKTKTLGSASVVSLQLSIMPSLIRRSSMAASNFGKKSIPRLWRSKRS